MSVIDYMYVVIESLTHSARLRLALAVIILVLLPAYLIVTQISASDMVAVRARLFANHPAEIAALRDDATKLPKPTFYGEEVEGGQTKGPTLA